MRIILSLLFSVALFASTLWWYVAIDKKNQVSEQIVLINKGLSNKEVSQIMHNQGIINNEIAITLILRAYKYISPVKAGQYLVPMNINMLQLLNIITSGKSIEHKITFIEGEITANIVNKISDIQLLEGEIKSAFTEGELLPSTYIYRFGDTKEKILKQMANNMKNTLAQEWERRGQGLALNSPEDVLILASMIEKETGLGTERHLVSSVFHNRLRLGMKLQSDPTTAYAITKGERQITLSLNDLQFESPYNTYFTNGLPPAPICNPGTESIKAALHPAETDYLYFVADGKTGGHRFASTYNEHLKNVASYRLNKSN